MVYGLVPVFTGEILDNESYVWYEKIRYYLCGKNNQEAIKMKKYFLVLIVMIIAVPISLQASESTLISGEIESGGFGGPVVKLTRINGDFTAMIGGRGAWIINNTIAIGGGGYIGATNLGKVIEGQSYDIILSYIGADLEVIFYSDRILHFTVDTLIGGGSLVYNTGGSSADDDSFFVIEPTVNLELNIATWARLCTGLGYRLTIGCDDLQDISDRDVSGLTASIMIKFGKF